MLHIICNKCIPKCSATKKPKPPETNSNDDDSEGMFDLVAKCSSFLSYGPSYYSNEPIRLKKTMIQIIFCGDLSD